jgi:NADP-dependent 3-hydroxy acid dehydrogenase YdfG
MLESLKLDLASRNSIENFVQEVKKIFKKIDILINNAGALFNTKEVVQ